MGIVCGCQLMYGPLDVDAMRRSAENLSYGSVVTYTTQVTGSGTHKLGTEEERALFQMFAIAEEAVNQWDANVAVAQRLGDVMAGDTSLVIVVAASSQEAAFDCCRFVAQSVSERVPVETSE